MKKLRAENLERKKEKTATERESREGDCGWREEKRGKSYEREIRKGGGCKIWKTEKKETEVEVAGQKNLGAGMISERGED